MASYYEEFTMKLGEQVGAWEDEDERLKAEISTQRERALDFQEMIDRDMAKGDATPQTAENRLNQEYAEKRMKKAERDLAEHEMKPFLSVDEYDKACRQIVADMKPKEIEWRETLQKAVESCLHVLDEMDALGSEANKCQSALKQACRDCGEDVTTELKMSHYSTGLHNSVTPNFVHDFRQTLNKMEMRLKQ